MRIQRRWMITATCALALLANVAGVDAQSSRQEKPRNRDVIIERSGGAVIAGAEQQAQWAFMDSQRDGDTFVFISGEMSFDGKTVKGAPYSAQAVSESVQMLAD